MYVFNKLEGEKKEYDRNDVNICIFLDIDY